MTRFRFTPAAAVLLAASALAVETRTWTQDSQADYEKATLKRISVRSDGRLALAPALSEILDASTTYLWAVAVDSKGNRYAGGGEPGASTAKLFLIDPKGAHRVLAELPGMEIHAIAVDRRDRVYAATSPDGKVYRVSAPGKFETFYDPGTKYIWAIAFDSQGNLLVATGDRGEIHRVTPAGKGEVWYRTDEAHARSLAVDAKDNVIVGTEPAGLILRITPKAEGFVLHQSTRREVTAVAVASDGSIYASAVGARQPAGPGVPVVPALPAPAPSVPAPTGTTAQAARAPVVAPPPTLGTGAPALTGGSEVWKIDPEGFPRRVWSDAQDIVYAIAFDKNGLPLLGTGNRGKIHRLDSDLLSTLLLSAEPTQVTALAVERGGAVYAATGNVGKVLRLGPALAADGYVEGDPLDAGFFSYWGRLRLAHDANGGGVTVETRSGNLDRPLKSWSPWAPVPLGGDTGRVASPPARFLQWKLTLKASAEGASPEVRLVETAYMPKNVAPVLEEIEITPANYRVPAQTLTLTPSQSLNLPPLGRMRRTPPPPVLTADSGTLNMQYARGYIGARWLARDDNGDALLARVEIRGRNEKEWKLVKDKVREKHLTWDSTAYPDGEYRVRVTVSDAPDNPAGSALEARIESDAFVIDNTPPEIVGLSAVPGGTRMTIVWKARDALNVVSTAEYSVDGGAWTPVLPVTRLADSAELDYSLTLDRPTPGEHTIAVRVTDEYENQRVEKIVVR
jgi:sugar lactone lactonase YvrE